MIKKFVKFAKKRSLKEIKKFFLKENLKNLIIESNQKPLKVNEMKVDKPYIPELEDLYRLYNFVTLNKRTTILEFGSGYSSLIFLLGLQHNSKKYLKEVKMLRRNNPFELFIVENEKKFLNISKKRILNFKKNIKDKNIRKKFDNIKINFVYSDCVMTLYKGNYATEYKKLPLCNPDFIYLDGPDQFKIKNRINNFTTAHKDMMPMSCDILKFENFLTPGTIIVADGRTANCEFMLHNFKRKWIHLHDRKNDQHIFYLNSATLGEYNKRQLKFYKT
tara:strand:+ start:35874 stop:36701 length:828 start_codon:yes stop_codon:yes gene_type:complete